MSKPMMKAFFLIFYGIVSAGAIGSSGVSGKMFLPDIEASEGQLKEVAGYKQWSRANTKRLFIIDPSTFG